MTRFDKRKTYPESSVDSKMEVLKVITPERVGGVIKSRGLANVAMNRAVGRIGYPHNWRIASQRLNIQGTSEQFGHDWVQGVTLQDNDYVVFRHNFSLDLGNPPPINSTAVYLPGIGTKITATAATNFGFQFGILALPHNVRMFFIATKVKGTFANWEGVDPAGVVHMRPGSAFDGKKTAIHSIGHLDAGTGTYGLTGVTNVSIGDEFIIHSMVLVARREVNSLPFDKIVQVTP